MVHRYSGEDPLKMTVARFFGVLGSIAEIRRIESGKPPTLAEMHEKKKAERGMI